MEGRSIHLLLCASLFAACCAQSTYYITPKANTPCPRHLEPCHTLREYVEGGYFYELPNNTILQFLPGNHTLETTITFASLIFLAIHGDSSSLPEVSSRIVCTWPAGFVFDAITELHINALAFISCGHNSFAAIELASLKYSYISSCIFDKNFVRVSNGTYYGGALYVWKSNLRLTRSELRNTFAHSGGAIGALEAKLSLTGNTFQNNSAHRGGIIHAVLSNLTLTKNTFLSNSAYYGGAISALHATLSLKWNTFKRNSAYAGGAIFYLSHERYFSLVGNMFTNNSAWNGGVLYATVRDSTVSFSTNTFYNNSATNVGGAIAVYQSTLMHFTGNTFQDNSAHSGGTTHTVFSNLSLTNNTFLNNSAYYGGAIDASTVNLSLERNIFKNNSAYGGGAVLLKNTLGYECNFSFLMNMFANNSAYIGGVLYVNVRNSTVRFSTNTFYNNSAINGGSIVVYQSTVNLVRNTFQNNSAYNGGALLSQLGTLSLSGNAFHANAALLSGGALAAMSSTIDITMSVFSGDDTAAYGQRSRVGSMTIENNRANYGAGLYVYQTKVTGNMVLTGNLAIQGGAIYSYEGTFSLNSTTIFSNNSATTGGGLLLSGGTQLYMQSNTVVQFINNTARETGGAVYSIESSPIQSCSPSTRIPKGLGVVLRTPQCFFQLQPSKTHHSLVCTPDKLKQFLASLNISIYFENNSASDAGSDLYGGHVDTCSVNSIERHCNETSKDIPLSGLVFDAITSASGAGSPNISSDPLGLCICRDKWPDCNSTRYAQSVHPGGTVEVPVIAYGQRHQPTVVVIEVTDVSVGMSLEYVVHSISRGCTTLTYTVHSDAVGTVQEMSLYAAGPCSPGQTITVTVDIQECPPGLQLLPDGQRCVCAERLQEYTDVCFVDNGTVMRRRNAKFWVGYTSGDESGLILHPHCPFDFCTSEEIYMNITNSDKQCDNNRSGLLCGKCSGNLSLVLSSSRCLQCSNSYVSLLVAFALAGIALMLFLLILKLTVAAGTVNGLIFYANIIKMNSTTFFRPATTKLNVLTVFISWLNLDLGIETCFYSGMNALVKTWLQFAFPIYVWGLVVTIMILSHFSTRMVRLLGRNPVAALATLFLLSYTKLLHTAFAALSYTTLEYPNRRVAVWLYDGNIEYLDNQHTPILVAAIVCLTFFFLPYTTMLTAAQWLQRLQGKLNLTALHWINSRYVVSFLDAYHAPYSTKRRYWVGLMLFLRFGLFLISAVNVFGDPRINLLAVAVTLFLLVPAMLAPDWIYKSGYLCLLELSFLLNLAILVLTTLYIYPNEANQNIVTFTSVSIAFTTFVGVVIYHTVQQIKSSQICMKLFSRHEQVGIPHMDDENDPAIDPPDRVYVSGHAPSQTVVDIRELRLRQNTHREAEDEYTRGANELHEPWGSVGLREPCMTSS